MFSEDRTQGVDSRALVVNAAQMLLRLLFIFLIFLSAESVSEFSYVTVS